MEIKDLIIFLIIFIIIMWLQNNDDKKFNNPKRETIYDIIKIPLFVALIILIVKDLNYKMYDSFKDLFTFNDAPKILHGGFSDIFIDPPDF